MGEVITKLERAIVERDDGFTEVHYHAHVFGRFWCWSCMSNDERWALGPIPAEMAMREFSRMAQQARMNQKMAELSGVVVPQLDRAYMNVH